MQIFGCKILRTLVKNNEEIILIGNDNKLHIIQSNCEVKIFGNNNSIHIINSKIQLYINGDQNCSDVQGINDIKVHFQSGFGNKINIENIDRQQSQNLLQVVNNCDPTQNIVSEGSKFNMSKQKQENEEGQNNKIKNIKKLKQKNSLPVQRQQVGEAFAALNIHAIRKTLKKNTNLNHQQLQYLPTNKHKNEQIECAICLLQIKQGDQEISLLCFHKFHNLCGKKWLKQSTHCPICKLDIKSELCKIIYH